MEGPLTSGRNTQPNEEIVQASTWLVAKKDTNENVYVSEKTWSNYSLFSYHLFQSSSNLTADPLLIVELQRCNDSNWKNQRGHKSHRWKSPARSGARPGVFWSDFEVTNLQGF